MSDKPRNMNELSQFIKLKFNRNVSNVGSQGGTAAFIQSYKQELEREARMLLDIFQKEIDNYYASYTPLQYRRTYKFKNSLKLEPVQVGKSGKKIIMSTLLSFDAETATHPSIFNGEDGFVPILINSGWKWHQKSGPYRLAHYEGFNFAGKALQTFMRTSQLKPTINYSYKYGGRVLKNDVLKYENGRYNLY